MERHSLPQKMAQAKDACARQGKGAIFWFTVKIENSQSQRREWRYDNMAVQPSSNDSVFDNFTDSEITLLAPYLAKLANVDIFEVSYILKILSVIKAEENENIQKWLEELESVIFTQNKEKYQKLVKLKKIVF